jgi:hypothetical protein
MRAGITDNDHGYVGYRKPAILTVSHENRYDVCPYVPGSWEKRGRRRRLVYPLRLEAAGLTREHTTVCTAIRFACLGLRETVVSIACYPDQETPECRRIHYRAYKCCRCNLRLFDFSLARFALILVLVLVSTYYN